MTRERAIKIWNDKLDSANSGPLVEDIAADAILAAVAEATAEERRRCLTIASRRRDIYAKKLADKSESNAIRKCASYAMDAIIALRCEIEQEPTNE